tara:strand:+ start:1261 stop:3060 length:1800 start_codon:yes stop_codon:yes gene_type:complete
MMAYNYWDDDAFPISTSDGPLSSVAFKRQIENLSEINTERFQKGCFWIGDDNVAALNENDRTVNWRLCSPWPMAWHPVFMYISQPIDKLRLRVVVDQITTSVGTNAFLTTSTAEPDFVVKLSASLVTPTWLYGHNSERSTQWHGDHTFTSITTTDQILTMDVPTFGQTGWVGIMLWSHSGVDDDLEYFGTPDPPPLPFADKIYGMDWNTDLDSALTVTKLERCVILKFTTDQGTTYETVTAKHATQYHTNTHGDADKSDLLSVYPPFGMIPADLTEILGTAPAYRLEMFRQGVCVISGISLESVPLALGSPVEELFNNSEPASYYGPYELAVQTNRLLKERVPVHAIKPAVESRGYTWLIRGKSGSPAEDSASIGQYFQYDGTTVATQPVANALNASSWLSLASAIVTHAPPAGDRAGLQAYLGLILVRDKFAEDDFGLEFRMAAYNPVTTGTVPGSIQTYDGDDIVSSDTEKVILSPEQISYQNYWNGEVEGKPYLSSNINSVNQHAHQSRVTTQFRGAFGQDPQNDYYDGVASDWRKVTPVGVTPKLLLTDTNVTYPAIIQVQAKLVTTHPDTGATLTGFHPDTIVVAFSLQSVELT